MKEACRHTYKVGAAQSHPNPSNKFRRHRSRTWIQHDACMKVRRENWEWGLNLDKGLCLADWSRIFRGRIMFRIFLVTFFLLWLHQCSLEAPGVFTMAFRSRWLSGVPFSLFSCGDELRWCPKLAASVVLVVGRRVPQTLHDLGHLTWLWEMGISGKIVHRSLDFDTGGVFLHLLFGKKKRHDVVSLAPQLLAQRGKCRRLDW